MARRATLWPGGIRPLTATLSTIAPPTSCERAMRTSSCGCRRMNGVIDASISEEHLRQPEHDLREVRDDDQRAEQRHQPRKDRHRRAFHRKLRDACQHEK